MVSCRDREHEDGQAPGAHRLRIEIERDNQAPGIARSAAEGLCEELTASQCGTLLLLVSELVTNAVLHSDAPAGLPVVLEIELDRAQVRVDVIDGGSGFEPVPRDPGQPGGGYGLYLVDHAATRWGSDLAAGTRVWFELAR